jgi:hypothetical protein
VKKMHLNIRVGGKLGLFLSGDEDGGRLLTWTLQGMDCKNHVDGSRSMTRCTAGSYM